MCFARGTISQSLYKRRGWDVRIARSVEQTWQKLRQVHSVWTKSQFFSLSLGSHRKRQAACGKGLHPLQRHVVNWPILFAFPGYFFSIIDPTAVWLPIIAPSRCVCTVFAYSDVRVGRGTSALRILNREEITSRAER